MEPFTRLTAVAAPLMRPNIDTDALFPAPFIQSMQIDFAAALFANWRADADFVLNRDEYAGAQVLLSGPNFGCGSSREHAVWALAARGFRAVIAPSYGDIFRDNAIRNGLLPVELPEEVIAAIAADLETANDKRLTVDLEAQTVTDGRGRSHAFTIDAAEREALLTGRDGIDMTLMQAEAIDRFQQADRTARPWAWAPMAAPVTQHQ